MKTPQVMVWADALRSGDYTQHRGRRTMQWNGAYSAYGVLCEVCPGWFAGGDPYPSTRVVKWATGSEAYHLHLDSPPEVRTRTGAALAWMDFRDLSHALPFAQIADLIEHFGVRVT